MITYLFDRSLSLSFSLQMVFDYLDAGADDEISLRRGKGT